MLLLKLYTHRQAEGITCVSTPMWKNFKIVPFKSFLIIWLMLWPFTSNYVANIEDFERGLRSSADICFALPQAKLESKYLHWRTALRGSCLCSEVFHWAFHSKATNPKSPSNQEWSYPGGVFRRAAFWPNGQPLCRADAADSCSSGVDVLQSSLPCYAGLASALGFKDTHGGLKKQNILSAVIRKAFHVTWKISLKCS